MTKFERVLLYVGAPKTGTTSVQIMLQQNRAELLKQGVYIPTAGRGGVGQHIELPAMVLKGNQREDLDRHFNLQEMDSETRRRNFFQHLDEEVSQISECHTLLFFSEHMFYSDKDEIPSYRELLDRYSSSLESILYLRRQDRWLAALSLQRRKALAHNNLETNPWPPPQYEQSVRGWDLASDRCLIQRYDQDLLLHGDLMADFCVTLGVDMGALSISRIRANPSLLQEQLELVDALNEKLMTMPVARRVRLRQGFVPVCTEILGGSRVESSRETAIAVFDSYREINTWLQQTKDPEGPEFFFNADFSDYKDEPESDRRYTREQLARFLGVISERLRARGLSPPSAPTEARAELIDQIVSSYISLRRAELREADQRSRATDGNWLVGESVAPSGQAASRGGKSDRL